MFTLSNVIQQKRTTVNLILETEWTEIKTGTLIDITKKPAFYWSFNKADFN